MVILKGHRNQDEEQFKGLKTIKSWLWRAPTSQAFEIFPWKFMETKLKLSSTKVCAEIYRRCFFASIWTKKHCSFSK